MCNFSITHVSRQRCVSRSFGADIIVSHFIIIGRDVEYFTFLVILLCSLCCIYSQHMPAFTIYPAFSNLKLFSFSTPPIPSTYLYLDFLRAKTKILLITARLTMSTNLATFANCLFLEASHSAPSQIHSGSKIFPVALLTTLIRRSGLETMEICGAVKVPVVRSNMAECQVVFAPIFRY